MTQPYRTNKSIPVVGPATSGGCPARAQACLCKFKATHKGKVHRCGCGGAWTGTEPDFHPVRFPHGLSFAEALDIYMGPFSFGGLA